MRNTFENKYNGFLELKSSFFECDTEQRLTHDFFIVTVRNSQLELHQRYKSELYLIKIFSSYRIRVCIHYFLTIWFMVPDICIPHTWVFKLLIFYKRYKQYPGTNAKIRSVILSRVCMLQLRKLFHMTLNIQNKFANWKTIFTQIVF